MLNNSSFFSSESLAERNRIIEEHRQLILEIRRIEKEIERILTDSGSAWRELEEERNARYVQIEPLIEQYWDWVPAVRLSRCPFCETDLLRLFDPIDLKGFWWMDRTQRPRPQPPSCEHFRLLLGAVNLNGLSAQGGLFECRPGPDVPFVIARILELPTMEAVVSSLAMHCGYTAYPIAYFSKVPPPVRSLTQSWAKKEYWFTLENGQSGWDIVDDVYDYDLVPWIKNGKLRWFQEGALSVEGASAHRYPYRDVKGKSQSQILLGNTLRYEKH